MRYLKTNTATRVTIGPFLDKTDGITPEVALAVTYCHLTFMVDDNGVPTLALDAKATASSGNNDMVHVSNDDAGFYDLELTASNVNYVGRSMLSVNDVTTHCPVFHEFTILPSQVYDSLISGSDVLDTNASLLGGTLPASSTEIADALLDRNMSTGTDSGTSTIRTPRQALRMLRNKWTILNSTLSVKKEDDSTESWSAVIGSTPSANPIISVDPAS